MIKELWGKWKKTAIKIGDFQFGLIFSILYYLLVVPFGLISNFFGDFLETKGFPEWEKVEANSSTLKKLKDQ